MKKIVISHSEKGGTAKSTLSGRMLESALRWGLRPYLVEGDIGIPDVAARYRGIVPGVRIPLQRADAADAAVVALFNRLEEVVEEDSADLVVINLPAGASATIDSRAQELIAPTVEMLGLELVTLYAVGPGQETVETLRNSLESGICSISSKVIVVPNEYLGEVERFEWHSSPIRERWLTRGGAEFRLPTLMPAVRDKARGLPGTLYQLVEGQAPGLTVVERSVLFRWLRQSEHIARLAFGELPSIEAAA